MGKEPQKTKILSHCGHGGKQQRLKQEWKGKREVCCADPSTAYYVPGTVRDTGNNITSALTKP